MFPRVATLDKLPTASAAWSRGAGRCAAATIVTLIVLLATACNNDRIARPVSDNGEVVLAGTPDAALGSPVPITFDTYDSSKQVVHPSAVTFPSAWHGQRFWLAITPYPNSDSRFENPSLYTSVTGDDWTVPSGVHNPVARSTHGYLSDPALAYDPATDELRLYYREVMQKSGGSAKPHHRADVIYVARSKDGVHWSVAHPIAGDAGRFVVSPTVTRSPAGDWRMWEVDAGRRGCDARDTRIILRQSSDGLRWPHRPSTVALTQPGYVPWHLDVHYVPQLGAYWALVAAYPHGSNCTATSLFLATSTDGMSWTTYATPLLARGALPQFAANVYRSTFAFDPDGATLTIWVTGATAVPGTSRKTPSDLRWSAAIWRTSRAAVLAHVNTVFEQRRASPDKQSSASLAQLAIDNALP